MKTPHSQVRRCLHATAPTLRLPSALLPQGGRASSSPVALETLVRQATSVISIGVADGAELALGRGSNFGRYQIVKCLGRGGFGDVWLAEQQGPQRREIALKFISPGMATSEVISRFEREWQAMAMMEHDNIAKVYDANCVDGAHYFSMEYLPGVPITKHAQDKNLSVRERIELFIPVCRAVHHAHQKRMLHRDLKPANILVVERDGVAIPKVIDFGLAKPISAQHRMVEEDNAEMPVTLPGYCVGTPQYMSPEQALGIPDIDEASDTYSLGAILYELLVGEPPITKSEMQGLAPHQQLDRVIRQAPQLPSKLWMRSKASGNTRCYDQSLGSNPKGISLQLRGALDWIVHKALDKNRSRRYASANELANDLMAYLRGEPVSACPPTLINRMRTSHLGRQFHSLVATIVAFALVIGGLMVIDQLQSTGGSHAHQPWALRRENQMVAAGEQSWTVSSDLGHFAVNEKMAVENTDALMKTMADKASPVCHARGLDDSFAIEKAAPSSPGMDQRRNVIGLAQVLDLADRKRATKVR